MTEKCAQCGCRLDISDLDSRYFDNEWYHNDCLEEFCESIEPIDRIIMEQLS